MPAQPYPLRSTTPTPVPLLDIKRQYDEIGAQIRAAIDRVCLSGRFILGPDCEALERELAAYCGVKHAVGCASGSDALLLALLALGIGPGDEVVLPSYTFFATASAVWRVGARPVFAEVDPGTLNLDPQDVARRITPATRAIIAVHLFGQCADMAALEQVAVRPAERPGDSPPVRLPIIEDAAQAIGAAIDGRRAGSLGAIGCFSFYPTKNLGCFGDGGMLTTEDDGLAESMRLLRVHGMNPRYHHRVVGINSRLDSLQAAVLRVKLPHLDSWIDMRANHAARYAELFAQYGLDRTLGLPQALPGRRHVWNQYVIRVPDGRRDALRRHLTESQIGTEIYYPVPLHLQECFKALGYAEGALPITEQAARETLALPIYPELTASERRQVVERIYQFFADGSARNQHALRGPNYLKRGTRAGTQPPK